MKCQCGTALYEIKHPDFSYLSHAQTLAILFKVQQFMV